MNKKEEMMVQVQIEEYSQMVQTCINALRYIMTHNGPMAKPYTPASQVAQEALEALKDIRSKAKGFKRDIKNGTIQEMTTASHKNTPLKKQLPSGGEIVFTQDHDLLFHQCCDCGLIHEVEVEWVAETYVDQDGDVLSAPKLITKWTRRDGPPTREEMAERGIQIEEVEQCES